MGSAAILRGLGEVSGRPCQSGLGVAGHGMLSRGVIEQSAVPMCVEEHAVYDAV